MTRKPPIPKSRRTRVLPALAALFMFGASLRVVSGLNEAFAQNSSVPNAVLAAQVSPSAPDIPSATPSSSATRHENRSGDTSQPTAEILVDLRRRELEIQDRETALAERQVLVSAAQDRLQAQITALQSAEQELSATMALADRAAEEDIGRMVSVFVAMGSEQAAAVFSEMAPDFAAGFLARLPPENAAAILSGLDPRQAYALSAIIAGRNALVPRN